MNYFIKLTQIVIFILAVSGLSGCGYFEDMYNGDNRNTGGGRDLITQTYTVRFNSNGGSSVLTVHAYHGEYVYAPTAPTRADSNFEGWFRDPGLTNRVIFPFPVTENITLYAGWTPIGNIPELSINRDLLLQLVNSYRAMGYSCGNKGYFEPANPLIWNDAIELAAYDHSLDMFTNDFFSHTGSDGSNLTDRMERRGYNWIVAGENIAWGYKTEEDVIEGWLSSPGHCANIMYPDFEEIGIAKVGTFWTQDFGTAR